MENELHTDDATAALKPRVPILYVRSATDGEGQLNERLEDTLELARLHGLELAAGYTIAEHGSGADIGRPGLQQVLRMAERGEISHLVCRDWARLSRNQRHLNRIMATLAEAGVTVVTRHGLNEPDSAPDLAMRHRAASR